EVGRPGPLDLQLGEGGLVEDRHRLAAGPVLGTDRGRPVLPRPAARPQILLTGGGVRLVPVDPLPAGFLAEGGTVLAVPEVGGGDAQRPAGGALVVGVADVVVGLVGLPDPLVGVGRRAVGGTEAADVHVPEVEARFAVDDPLGDHFADPARPGEAVGAEAGADEEPRHLGFAEAELVVGGESLRAVDQFGDGDLRHRRDATFGVAGDLLEAVPVLFQQATVEVRRDRLEAAGPAREERLFATALISTHHQPVAVL